MEESTPVFKIPDSKLLKQKKAEPSPVPTAEESEQIANPGEKPALSPNHPYVEPKWSDKPTSGVYSFEVLKNGQIIEKVDNLQTKSFWVFGRLPDNDISLAHPTISRYHLVLQYRPNVEDSNDDEEKVDPGWYVYDLGSTHGSFVNKQRIPVKTYVRIRVGYILKMGASTRQFILMGPESDEEEVSSMTITEMKEKKQKQLNEILQKREEEKRQKEDEGVTWGMAEDADEESDLSVNPFATTTNEEMFLDDPKKTLRGFFEREGHNLDYNVEDLPNGTFVCRIELPIDDDQGRPIVAEVTHKGKKKECVLQCAMEACRILDRHGVLRTATHEPMRRRKKDSDSEDDDDFLDRTGDVERRRQRKTAPTVSNSLSYTDLLAQEKEVIEKIKDLDTKIEEYQNKTKQKNSETESDDLDEFMSNLKEDKNYDKVEVRKFRIEQQQLQHNLKKIKKMIEIAKPIELPKLVTEKKEETTVKKSLPLFGKRIKLNKSFGVKSADPKPQTLKSDNDDEMEEKEEIEDVKMEEVKEKDSNLVKENKTVLENPNRVLGPAVISPSISSSEEVKPDFKQPQKEEISSEAKKISRKRVRNREKARENVDFDESEEHPDKYSEWLPPENQQGDGITSLNDKLGY